MIKYTQMVFLSYTCSVSIVTFHPHIGLNMAPVEVFLKGLLKKDNTGIFKTLYAII